eukprot:CAMPEP_0184342974 /NCGR_PEP_ID=MMETSP1089-20130417/11537_1 /TAXON_ID=38269 ORGANISM="Gloeochaete wittrockiana, Strain SAG46.84" /NCGR_SAMPLE_ID=MMETSP1089 /ASSEMBLY_ACC=CAM_ASM_000445 /LENGTH=178 /DNA_ID=CAMNT_0026672081 /DNA_START=249 /DNA_END=782 /DNA_ORIENTATION=-
MSDATSGRVSPSPRGSNKGPVSSPNGTGSSIFGDEDEDMDGKKRGRPRGSMLVSPLKPCRWGPTEDRRLIEVVNDQRPTKRSEWIAISEMFGRTGTSALQHYQILMRKKRNSGPGGNGANGGPSPSTVLNPDPDDDMEDDDRSEDKGSTHAGDRSPVSSDDGADGTVVSGSGGSAGTG